MLNHSLTSKAAARKKRQRKTESKKWTDGQWTDYHQDRQDRVDRGSVVSSHFNDYSTVGSEADVANLSDFRDFQEESSATIPEDEPVQSTSQSSTSWSSSGWYDSDKWTGGYRKYRHVQNGAARATVALDGLSVLQPGDAASIVAILSPFGSGGALLLIAKL